MKGLNGKNFIVTGGASGIGFATARRLIEEGANVVIGGRTEARLAEARNHIGGGDSLVTQVFDLENEDSIIALVARAVATFGRVDGLANVAAAIIPEIMAADQGVDTMQADLWSRVLRINLIGSGLVMRETLPHLVEAGGGSIVNISSAAAWLGSPQSSAYAASKIGLHSVTRHTAKTWGPKNIRCNTIVSGKVLTETGATVMPTLVKGYNEALLAKMCLPRLGEPEDVASMVTFLLSDDSAWLTGQILSVDGGLTMRE